MVDWYWMPLPSHFPFIGPKIGRAGRRTHTWVWHMTDKFVSGFVKIRFAVGGFSISTILLPVTRYCAEERSPSLEEFKRSLDGTCSMWRMGEQDVNESDMVASDAMWRLHGTGHEGNYYARWGHLPVEAQESATGIIEAFCRTPYVKDTHACTSTLEASLRIVFVL